MAKLDPGDDYPDDPTRAPGGFDFFAALANVTGPLRRWVAASPARALSPDETLLVVARVKVVESEPDGQHYLSLPQLRLPRGTERGRWFVQVNQVAVGRREYQCPLGLAIRSVSVGDDGTLRLAITLEPTIARQLGLAAPQLELALSADARAKLPVRFGPAVAPAAAIATILRLGGVSVAKVAARAEQLARTPKPTKREAVAVIEQCLAALRPR